jgi:hypothetical protein
MQRQMEKSMTTKRRHRHHLDHRTSPHRPKSRRRWSWDRTSSNSSRPRRILVTSLGEQRRTPKLRWKWTMAQRQEEEAMMGTTMAPLPMASVRPIASSRK